MELYKDTPIATQIGEPPARTVPTLVCDDGSVVFESLAIAEELASRHPDRPFWPRDSRTRACARSLTAAMHSGFAALRAECPMCLRTAYRDVPEGDALVTDLRRIERLWKYALGQSGGPWLCGDYSVADAFFAPVAGAHRGLRAVSR